MSTAPLPKQPNEKLTVEGRWTISVIGPDGKEKDRREGKNLITNAGINHLRNYTFFGSFSTYQDDPMSYIAIGSGSTAPTATDTALSSELARAVFDTVTEGGTGVVTVETTFAAGTGTGSIAEVGILNAASSGDLFNRHTFSAIAKDAGDDLKCTCSITFAVGS